MKEDEHSDEEQSDESLLNHVPFVSTCPYFARTYVPTSLRLTCLYIFLVPTCLHVLNHFVPTCADFSGAYEPTTTPDLRNGIYPSADVKSDEN